ncbi:hypothetical protein BC826DRAFT_1033401, partial [Russula brevipes]
MRDRRCFCHARGAAVHATPAVNGGAASATAHTPCTVQSGTSPRSVVAPGPVPPH